MKVLINAASAHMGGAFTYLRNVLHWLVELAPDDEFVVIVPHETKHQLQEVTSDGNITFDSFPFEQTGGMRRMGFDQISIRRNIKKQNVDLLFSNTGFGTYWCSCPQVVLIRNPVYFNTDFHNKYRELGRSLRQNVIRRKMSEYTIRHSDLVLFPTLAMQNMVADYVDLGDKQTRVIHYGFDKDAFTAGDSSTPENIQELDRFREQGYHILLNVSTYAVHKNFETLIEALPHLKNRGIRFKLVTTTSRDRTGDKTEYDRMVERAKELDVKKDWHEIGYVPYGDLHQLYSRAGLFVFPSFTESFGHSLVEALASGLPTIAADMPVNQEVCREAGLYFSKFDVMDCAEKIAHVLENPSERTSLSSRAFQRAEHFSWRDYTGELLQHFNSLLKH